MPKIDTKFVTKEIVTTVEEQVFVLELNEEELRWLRLLTGSILPKSSEDPSKNSKGYKVIQPIYDVLVECMEANAIVRLDSRHVKTPLVFLSADNS